MSEDTDDEVKSHSELGHLDRELAFILDIPLELSVELGKSRMLINDLLQLGQGPLEGGIRQV